MKKNCKIVTTYFGNRRRYPHNFEESMDMFSKMIEKEKQVDAGIDCDTIIVNHLCEQNSHKVIELLDSLNGTKTKNGKIITMNRPYDNGKGLGFKSRHYAFQKYKNNYEYWFFVEDDINFFLDDYYKKCVNILKEKSHVAFVCTHFGGLTGGKGGHKSNHCVHCHGGVGCTHIKFLKELINFNGKIPYTNFLPAYGVGLPSSNKNNRTERESTNLFVKMGYSLAKIDNVTDFPLFKKEQRMWHKKGLTKYDEYHPEKGYIKWK
tara:strand:+ start:3939 stop:4727 length:789 start_codon:yes stop_codon:yes gene_type:complete